MSKKIIRRISIFVCLLMLITSCALPVFADDNAMYRRPISINRIIEYEKNYSFTEEEIDMITNVVMHEVGGVCGYVSITYSNGETFTYNDGCMLHKIHTMVLINQFNSSLFPDSISKCIRQCWMRGLENTGYYSRNNSTWQHCREDVVDVLENGFTIPDGVFAATCDAYFANSYSGFSLYATVYWNTGWYSGVFYYYQYNA